MKRPPKLKNPSKDHDLLKFAGIYLVIVVGAFFALGWLAGCEQPVRLESTDTTLPAIPATDPAAIIAKQRAVVDAALGEYYDAMEALTHDRVTWAIGRMEADVRAMHAARIGDRVGLTKYVQMRRKMEEVGAELDSLEFQHRATLDYLRLQMPEWDRKYPGWWLMAGAKK